MGNEETFRDVVRDTHELTNNVYAKVNSVALKLWDEIEKDDEYKEPETIRDEASLTRLHLTKVATRLDSIEQELSRSTRKEKEDGPKGHHGII